MRRGSRLAALGGALAIMATMASVSIAPGVAAPGDGAFVVEVYGDFVHLFAWAGQSTITVSIDDPATGPGVDFTKTETGPADTGFNINFWDEYDVKPGDVVEVTDGATTLTHTVRNLAITGLDPGTDMVAGSADPGSTVDLNIGGPEPIPVPFQTSVTADASGNWVANLGALSYDLLDGAWTSALRIDSNGNATSYTLNPTFNVFVDANALWTWGWFAGSTLTLTIDAGTGPGYTTTAVFPSSPPYTMMIDFDGFDVLPDHIVTLSDGVSNVTHTMRNLTLDYVNGHTGWVGGTADPGSLVALESWQDAFPPSNVTADAEGNWAAGPFALNVPGGVRAVIRDAVANGTQADRHVSVPHVVMFYGAWGYPEPDMWTTNVNGFEWRPGSVVTLEIEDPTTATVEYTATTIVDQAEDAYFELFGTFGGTFVVEHGWLVTLYDDQEPQTIKTHEVDYLTVEAIDPDTDSVAGSAEPGAELHVRVFDPSLPFPEGDDRFATTNPAGEWAASFAGTTDMDFGSSGWVIGPLDDDGDKTQVNWYLIPPPDFVDVDIDIMPDSDSNPINLKSNGVIPVAIVTTDDFDATTVDPMSVRFGPAEATEAHGRAHLEDVDHDGDIDLMLHFRTQETGILPVDSKACLTGETFDGDALRGCDVITVKGGSNVFGGHYYKVIDEPATWHDAAAYCEQDGGYLVTISSAEENQFVYNLTDIGNQTWLGATDEAVEGAWEWVTGEPFDYTNWGPGEPNNSAPGPDPTLGEDYLTFHGEGAYDPPLPGVWNDWQYEDDGSESTLPFVCEYEPTT